MEALIILAVNSATSVLKKYVYPKYGKNGVHLLLFLLSFAAALVYSMKNEWVSLWLFIQRGLAVLALSVSFYELVLSRFSLFKQKLD